MLSFMRDNERKNSLPESKKLRVSKKTFDNKQSPASPDYLVPVAHGRNLKHSTIMLAVLFSIGALCLWYMVNKTAPKTVSAAVENEETQIENAIAQVIGIKTEMNGRMNDVVNRLYQFSEINQVKVDELKKNPFRLDLFAEDAQNEVDFSREELRSELQKKCRGLKLGSIMESPQGNCCMIDDDIFYVGDSIKGFTVSKIEGEFVELMSHGIRVILKMPE